MITLAAGDVGKEPGEHVVVLVSDGKETCEAIPAPPAVRDRSVQRNEMVLREVW